MIRTLDKKDINGLNMLPPIDWQFNYEAFLTSLITDDFFHAFIIIRNNQIAGTGNIIIKEKVGWLSNIIIDKRFRGLGLGTQMTRFLINFSRNKGCETQLLIATKPGEAIYKKIGFIKSTEYLCFDSEVDMSYSPKDSIKALKSSDFEIVYHLDREVNGEDRIHLLSKYYRNGFGFFNQKNELQGFFLPEFGSGLVLSRNNRAGVELLRLKHSKKGKRTRIPVNNQAGITVLKSLNLRQGDNYTRMTLGKEIRWNPEFIFSFGGGYCG